MLKFLKKHPKKLVSMAAVLLLLGYCSTLERSFLDRFDRYVILDTIKDEKTGKTVELGMLGNFSSTTYEVGVYDVPNSNRRSADLHKAVIVLVGSMVPEPKLEYDGKCYFVRGELETGWDQVVPTWKDPTTGNQLCFYVLIFNGKKISSFQ
jgi:hypothetical protein